MSFLLDTNVLSEGMKPRPDPRVVDWLDQVAEDDVYVSVLSFGEINRGVALLPGGQRKTALQRWLFEDLPGRFDGRILVVDANVMVVWGELMARSKRRGGNLGVMDGLFAASASAYGMTLVTRNTKDFTATGVALFDPWVE